MARASEAEPIQADRGVDPMNRRRGTVKITTGLLGVLVLTALAPLDRALANPGEDFVACQTMLMKKVK